VIINVPKLSGICVKITILSVCATLGTAAAVPQNLIGGLYKVTEVTQEGNHKPARNTQMRCISGGVSTRKNMTDLVPTFKDAACVPESDVLDEARRTFHNVRKCTDSDGQAIISVSGKWTATSFATKLTVKGRLEKAIAFSSKIAAVRIRDCSAEDFPRMITPQPHR
jgi:hypothetical protein